LASAAASPPAATWFVGGLGPCAFGAGTLRSRWRGDRHDSRQAACPSPPAGLLARARVLLLDPLIELGEPLFHRPLDLRARRAWLFRPDARPIGTDGFGWWIGVARFGLNGDLRREFRHLPKS
jgi:hypothetical protein